MGDSVFSFAIIAPSIVDFYNITDKRHSARRSYFDVRKLADEVFFKFAICHSAPFVSAHVGFFLFVVILEKNFDRFADV